MLRRRKNPTNFLFTAALVGLGFPGVLKSRGTLLSQNDRPLTSVLMTRSEQYGRRLRTESTNSSLDTATTDVRSPDGVAIMIQMHAVMSERERDQASNRARATLAAAKARGVKVVSLNVV